MLFFQLWYLMRLENDMDHLGAKTRTQWRRLYMASVIFMGIGGILPASVIHGALAHAPSRELVATSNGILMRVPQ